METLRFNALIFFRRDRVLESLMIAAIKQFASRYIRRIQRPGIQHAGWVAVDL